MKDRRKDKNRSIKTPFLNGVKPIPKVGRKCKMKVDNDPFSIMEASSRSNINQSLKNVKGT